MVLILSSFLKFRTKNGLIMEEFGLCLIYDYDGRWLLCKPARSDNYHLHCCEVCKLLATVATASNWVFPGKINPTV